MLYSLVQAVQLDNFAHKDHVGMVWSLVVLILINIAKITNSTGSENSELNCTIINGRFICILMTMNMVAYELKRLDVYLEAQYGNS